MVGRDILERRLAHLETLLLDLRELAGAERAAFIVDRRLHGLAERWLQVAAECCIDLGNHVIAARAWGTPDSYRDTFRILRAHGVLDAPLASAMEGWAGLRDVLAHLYLEVDHARLWEVLQRELDQLAAFATAIAAATSA